MDRAVDGVAGGVDVVRTLQRLLPMEVDAHQARRGDLLEHEPVRLDQEVMRAGHARRDVREHQIVPAEVRHEAIAGREIDARPPLLRSDLVANVAELAVDDPHLHKSPVPLGKTNGRVKAYGSRLRGTSTAGGMGLVGRALARLPGKNPHSRSEEVGFIAWRTDLSGYRGDTQPRTAVHESSPRPHRRTDAALSGGCGSRPRAPTRPRCPGPPQ